MAPPTPLPAYVYKIVPTTPPSPIPPQYPLSDLDQKDGFVHLSIATQVSSQSRIVTLDFPALLYPNIVFHSLSCVPSKLHSSTPT